MVRFLKITAIVVLMFFMGTFPVQAESEHLNEILDIRGADPSNPEVQQMVENLSRVEDRIYDHLSRNNVKIILMTQPLTELPEFSHLSGQVPLGWENTESTWDEVPGAGGQNVAARIGYSDPGEASGHSAVNLELHELGHAVDEYSSGFKISDWSTFQQIQNREKDGLYLDSGIPEYYDRPGEYFAESFAHYYYNDASRKKLQKRAPQTYQFFDTLAHKIMTIEEVTGNTVSFDWDAYDGAEQYEIYRNNQLIDTVDEAEYTDNGLNTSNQYQYYVRALNASGAPLYTSFYRTVVTKDTPDFGPSPLEEKLVEAEELLIQHDSERLQNAVNNSRELLESNQVTQEAIDQQLDALNTQIDNVERLIEKRESDSTENNIEGANNNEDEVESTDQNTEDERTTGQTATNESDSESSNENLNTVTNNNQVENESIENNNSNRMLAIIFVSLLIVVTIIGTALYMLLRDDH